MELSDFPNAKELKFKKNEYLFYESEPLEYVYFLISGKIAGNLININGNEFFADVVESGLGIQSVAALGMLIAEEITYSFNMFALTDVVCYQISQLDMKAYLQCHAEETLKFTKKLMVLYINLCKKLNSRQQLKTIERYCKFILEHGIWINENLVLDKTYSNVEVSKLLGIHPVTLSRMQTALQTEEMIERTKSGILVRDVDKIEQCANGVLNVNYRKHTIPNGV